MLDKFFSMSALFVATLLAASISLAKNINLYDQPKADAKVVGTIDPSQGIVPIYTPNQSDWVKIGDPRNGNVGWVKSNDLADSGAVATGYSITQQTTSDGKQPPSFIMKFGTPSQLTPEQAKKMEKEIEEQKVIIQKSMQQLMQDIYDASGIFVPMPVIVTPPQPQPAPVAVPQKK